MRYFNYPDCKTSKLFHFYRERICNIANIYLQDLSSMKDEGGVASYHPAGRLITLRLPIFFDVDICFGFDFGGFTVNADAEINCRIAV